MTILERVEDAVAQGAMFSFEALKLLSEFCVKAIGVVYVVTCCASVLTGPFVVFVVISASFLAVAGAVMTEVCVVVPLALCAGLVTALARLLEPVVLEEPPRALRPRPPVRHPAHRPAVALPARRPMAPGARCPVCATGLERAVVVCARCETPHHRECWTYEGKCAIYGCQ